MMIKCLSSARRDSLAKNGSWVHNHSEMEQRRSGRFRIREVKMYQTTGTNELFDVYAFSQLNLPS